MSTIIRRLGRHAVLGAAVAAVATVAAVAAVAALTSVVACSSSSTATSAVPAVPSTLVPLPSVRSTTPAASAPTTTVAASPTGQLPSDLTPNVVTDECLLTATELGALISRGPIRAENTELTGGGAARRSCFYTPDNADDPAARIDIYASASVPPPDLLARIVANGGHPLPEVGQGAVVIAGREGVFELVVASPTLLAVLTILPGGAAIQPSDQSWTAAGTAMASRLPR
jgi:hypothetical protein